MTLHRPTYISHIILSTMLLTACGGGGSGGSDSSTQTKQQQVTPPKTSQPQTNQPQTNPQQTSQSDTDKQQTTPPKTSQTTTQTTQTAQPSIESTVTFKPVVALGISPQKPIVGQDVQFYLAKYSTASPIKKIEWQVIKNNKVVARSSEKRAKFSFADAGTYTVSNTLTFKDGTRKKTNQTFTQRPMKITQVQLPKDGVFAGDTYNFTISGEFPMTATASVDDAKCDYIQPIPSKYNRQTGYYATEIRMRCASLMARSSTLTVFQAKGSKNTLTEKITIKPPRFNAFYDDLPDLENCKTGQLTEATKQAALKQLNDIRALHGLSAVSYDYSHDKQMMEAALIMARNEDLSHDPTSNWKCFSDDGAAGARNNLGGGGDYGRIKIRQVESIYKMTQDDVIRYIHDANNRKKNNVGHRLSLLNPFLKTTAYGMVWGWNGKNYSRANSLKQAKSRDEFYNAVTKYDFVAYPMYAYPKKYFDAQAMLSFSAVVDKGDFWKNLKVDFSESTVTVTSSQGKTKHAIKDVSYDNKGWMNNIQFRLVEGVKENHTYQVTVKNVKSESGTRDYNYWFRITPE